MPESTHMAIIEHSETLPGTPEVLFDITQDYSMRTAWDPFPESYEFHNGAKQAAKGVHLTVRAKNGHRMRVEYVSFNRPRTAAIHMISGPWFIRRFAGTWQFVAESNQTTRVSFKYNIVAGPGVLGRLLQPLLNLSFSRHAKQRLLALKSFVEHRDPHTRT